MESVNAFFQTLYTNFNSRDINLVIAEMADDVRWANGMEGGFVYGLDGVREYWTRQFAQVSAIVTPLEIQSHDGLVKIKVHQVVHDMDGNLLADEMVDHIFYLKQGKIEAFEIGGKE